MGMKANSKQWEEFNNYIGGEVWTKTSMNSYGNVTNQKTKKFKHETKNSQVYRCCVWSWVETGEDLENRIRKLEMRLRA
jgi:hypothetical protein